MLISMLAVNAYAANIVVQTDTPPMHQIPMVAENEHPQGCKCGADACTRNAVYIPVPEVEEIPVAPVSQKAPEVQAAPAPVAPAPVEYVPTYGASVKIKDSTATDYIKNNYSDYGEFKLTFYCKCAKCCGTNTGKTASGTYVEEGRTVAVSRAQIPMGTKLHIDGFGDFIAEDTGSGIGKNRIDIYVDSHSKAWDLGVKYARVYVK